MDREFIKQYIEKRVLDEESFVKEILFATFAKMKLEGNDELSLDKESVSKYAPRLESVLSRLGIISEAFTRTPVEETYDAFASYAIEILIGRKFGYFNSEYNKITIEINPYMINKTLKNYEELTDLINECFESITGDFTYIEGKNNISVSDNESIDKLINYCKATPASPIEDGKGFYKVKSQDFYFPDGTIQAREYIDKEKTSVVVPITEEGNIVLVAQPIALSDEGALLEFPAGYWELGENGQDAGIRELGEETGYVPQKITYLGSHYQDPGSIRQKVEIYLATGCRKVKSQKLDKGEFVKYIEVPYNYALYLLDNGYLKDANTYIALSKVDRLLSREYTWQDQDNIDVTNNIGLPIKRK